MSMDELWALWELRRPRERVGSLDEDDLAELYALLKEEE